MDEGAASDEGSGSDAGEASADDGDDERDRRRSSSHEGAGRARRLNAGLQNPVEAGTDVRQRKKPKRKHRASAGTGGSRRGQGIVSDVCN